MTPIQSALEDLQFMKDKSIDPFAEIIWGMAITIVKEHSPESSCSLCMKYREALKDANELLKTLLLGISEDNHVHTLVKQHIAKLEDALK